MFEHGLRQASMALLLALATVAPANADGPAAGFKLDPERTVISPEVGRQRLVICGHRPAAPSGAQNAGIQRQNQYVAARNRFAGLKDAHVLIGPGPEHQEKQL